MLQSLTWLHTRRSTDCDPCCFVRHKRIDLSRLDSAKSGCVTSELHVVNSTSGCLRSQISFAQTKLRKSIDTNVFTLTTTRYKHENHKCHVRHVRYHPLAWGHITHCKTHNSSLHSPLYIQLSPSARTPPRAIHCALRLVRCGTPSK